MEVYYYYVMCMLSFIYKSLQIQKFLHSWHELHAYIHYNTLNGRLQILRLHSLIYIFSCYTLEINFYVNTYLHKPIYTTKHATTYKNAYIYIYIYTIYIA